MEIKSDFSLTRLFITKEINISIDSKQSFVVKVKTVKDFYVDNKWNGVYCLWCMDILQWKNMLNQDFTNVWEYIKFLIFDLGKYSQYRDVADSFIQYLQDVILNLEFDWQRKECKIGSLTITSEIWDYIIYILKLTCGEKVEQPPIFNSPEERAFYLKQLEYEARIKKIKQQNQGDKDSLIKGMLAIVYSFPSLTLDYLFEQTMAQIHWLQKMAAGEVSYSINAQAMAAGNMKKGKKLDFFIK